jgi:prepilin-type N-terminal cleavage/methylation domain-containing protein
MRSRRPGFTFIELLCVITVIAILAAILFPVFAQAREKARSTSCQSNLHQIAMALHLYAQDNNGRFPPNDNELAPLMPKVKNYAVFRCPSDSYTFKRDLKQPETPDLESTGMPSFRKMPPLETSYDYRGGLRSDDWGDIPIASDRVPQRITGGNDTPEYVIHGPFLHGEGANRVTLGGSVKWVHDKTWAPVTEGQKRWLADRSRPKPPTMDGPGRRSTSWRSGAAVE